MTQENVENHHKPMRLKGYDYASPGFYFVTVCTWNQECILAGVQNFKVQVSAIGKIVENTLLGLPAHFENVSVDTSVIMPNHIHAIVEITKFGVPLGRIIGSFKSAATNICFVKGLLAADRSLWQHGYYDHIIRSERALLGIRQYIVDNPVKWHLDELNPRY
jgi:REP element-mobilizing transposase RayT